VLHECDARYTRVTRITPYGVMCAILGSLQTEQMGKLPEMGGAINKDTVT